MVNHCKTVHEKRRDHQSATLQQPLRQGGGRVESINPLIPEICIYISKYREVQLLC
jgi:hypothetical protein